MENPLLKYLAFVKTAEEGSFTRAAQALNYAQSSVSKMVADLEREWGMTLLERSKSGVCLTSAGEQIIPFLRKILHDYREMDGQICRMNGIETGVVRIGTFASVAINWLPNMTIPALSMKCFWGTMGRWNAGSSRAGWTAAFCGFPPWRNSTRSC